MDLQLNNFLQTRSPDRILLDRTKEDEAIRLDLQELHEAISQRDSLPPTLTSSDIEVYRLGITPDETPLIIRTSDISKSPQFSDSS